ncbi:MAG: glycosyltransferase family 4 protein [Proteobacteria bacterium]|nr:glycosyltransferase family 4 protein [Pseudomonadota bacterium]
MARKRQRQTKTKSAGKGAPGTGGPRKAHLSVAQVHWGFPPIIGGVETHLATMLPEFNRMGHRTALLTGAFEGCRQEYDYQGTRIVRTPLMDLNWLFKRGLSGLDDEIAELFTGFVESARPDVIHAHNMHYFSKPHAKALSEVAKKKGLPLVLTAHNVWDEDLYLDLTRDVPWTHIIAVSHYIRREIIGIGVDQRRCTTIHHGIDHRKFSHDADTRSIYAKYPQLRGRRLVFHPARMGLAKGCDVSIKAFNIVHRRFPDAMLVLAGTKNIIDWGATQQKDIAYFIRLLKFFGLQKHVLIDSYELEQMPGLYAASDVVLYPSTAMEPFGLTMLEAMAAKKPIIVTNAGGMPEIIQDQINGFVVPIKNFEALAGRILRLLSEEDLRTDMGETGRALVEQRYTKEIMSENHVNLYRKLLS